MPGKALSEFKRSWAGKYSAPLYFALALTSPTAVADQADDSAFFQHNSQLAYNAVFGLPAAAPRLIQTLEWQVSLEHNNQFAGGTSRQERLLLDGESSTLTLRHRQRLAACWQFEASVPFIAHNEGLFDRAIDDFHQIFGLPDANRDATDFNSLSYAFEDEDGIRHTITNPQSGIGDIQFAVQRALGGCIATADSTKAEPLVRLGVKLPTGNPNELRGSGEFDVYADVQSSIWSPARRWNTAVAAGVLFNGETDRFAEQRQLVGYGSAGLQFVLHHNFRLLAQIDAHTPFYRSELRELGDTAVSLTLGARYLAGSRYTYEFSFSEDAAIDTTPDIAVRLAVTYRPDQTR